MRVSEPVASGLMRRRNGGLGRKVLYEASVKPAKDSNAEGVSCSDQRTLTSMQFHSPVALCT